AGTSTNSGSTLVADLSGTGGLQEALNAISPTAVVPAWACVVPEFRSREPGKSGRWQRSA
ncbi:hypothetical protein, partial [uncultured Thiodictyon sp.]|uniref:hypothetical protein n=1 Tax=uncultured Thiodictyon sp. TaxID=1846217 RepID=UPI0025D7C536